MNALAAFREFSRLKCTKADLSAFVSKYGAIGDLNLSGLETPLGKVRSEVSAARNALRLFNALHAGESALKLTVRIREGRCRFWSDDEVPSASGRKRFPRSSYSETAESRAEGGRLILARIINEHLRGVRPEVVVIDGSLAVEPARPRDLLSAMWLAFAKTVAGSAVCDYCGKSFPAKRPVRRRYCSDSCRVLSYRKRKKASESTPHSEAVSRAK